MKRIAIIGNGISGITAARHIRKLSDHHITVISAETDYFFSRTALMYIYMGHMKFEHTKPYEDWFWEKNRINLMRKYVKQVDVQNKQLLFDGGGNIEYDVLILGTGSQPNKFGWPGQDLAGVQTLYSYPDLKLMERNTGKVERAVVTGGGLTGIEMTEMLLSRNIPVTFLVRESSFWNKVLPPEESEMVNRHIREHKVDLRLGTELKEILADDKGCARAVVTKGGEEIPCQFVGLTTGVSPNTRFLEGCGIETDRGILVNEYLETNVQDVYAVGDCAQHRTPPGERRPVEQVWYTGRMMGETVAQTVCGNRTAYAPGNWFNSAKFFDIEYQTYGWVWNEPKAHEAVFYWERGDGKACLRLVYHKEQKHILGINVFGMRLRHDVCDRWLTGKKHVEEVLSELPDANFDPELYKKYERGIIDQYNRENNTNVKPKPKSWKRILNLT